MWRQAFLDHPHARGESYGEHFRIASGFASELLAAGLACAVHAVAPCLFERAGSAAIARLHDRMIANRRGPAPSVDSRTQSTLTAL
jgi:hypothetical protein